MPMCYSGIRNILSGIVWLADCVDRGDGDWPYNGIYLYLSIPEIIENIGQRFVGPNVPGIVSEGDYKMIDDPTCGCVWRANVINE